MCTCSKHILPTSTSCLYSYIGRTGYWRDSGRDHCRDTPSYPDSKQNPLLLSRASLCLGLCCHWGSLFGQPLFVDNTRDTCSIACTRLTAYRFPLPSRRCDPTHRAARQRQSRCNSHHGGTGAEEGYWAAICCPCRVGEQMDALGGALVWPTSIATKHSMIPGVNCSRQRDKRNISEALIAQDQTKHFIVQVA